MENSGLPLSVVVFIVLLTLKLSGVIDWSWWWITLPLWWLIPVIVIVIIIALIAVLFGELVRMIKEED